MPFETETKALYLLMDIAVIFRLSNIFYNIIMTDFNILLI